MNKFVLLTKPKGREIYWNGNGHLFPEMTARLADAQDFPTARAAYNFARDIETMQTFRVGRRPISVNLRGNVDEC